jgi:phosphotransferase family enzyme
VADEIVLSGGNMTPVVRVGDTVRRAGGPWTPTIHALLRHLRASGFAAIPEPLGVDERGREIISLLPGRVATYPLDDFVLAERTLVRIAQMLRAYHDATIGFVPPADAVWQWPAHDPAEVICHNDFAPYNVLFEGSEPTGVIDFDVASPGPRAWDMGYTAYRFVPLTAPGNPDVAHPGDAEQARRLEVFCAAYGDNRIGPHDVAAAALAKLRELVAFIVSRAAAGDAAQQAVLARGDRAIYEGDIAFLEGR